MAFGEIGRELDRTLGRGNCVRIERLQLIGLGIFAGERGEGPGASGVSEREFLILRDRQFEMGQRGAIGRLVPREAI